MWRRTTTLATIQPQALGAYSSWSTAKSSCWWTLTYPTLSGSHASTIRTGNTYLSFCTSAPLTRRERLEELLKKELNPTRLVVVDDTGWFMCDRHTIEILITT